MKRPNFFIVGAPKCGTTSLYRYLESHPQVYMSIPKEVNYFSKSALEKQGLYYSDYKVQNEKEYLSLFKEATEIHQAVGEASVSYLFYPEVARCIYAFNANSKIVIVLRNPVDRAWSHYLMDKRLGLVRKSFMQIFSSNEEEDRLNFQQYFLLGNYSSQLEVYFNIFGKENIKVFFTEDLKNNRNALKEELMLFLGISDFYIQEASEHNKYKNPKGFFVQYLYRLTTLRRFFKRYMPASLLKHWGKYLFESKYPTLSDADRAILNEYYRQDIVKLEELLSIDLTGWR